MTLITPVGDITISEANDAIVSLDWGTGRDQSRSPLLQETARQLHAYFDGQLTNFDVPLSPAASNHSKKVLQAMQAIPYGKTRTYGEIAADIASSARAVGGACARNPIPILIPCHRVLSAGNGMGGYSGDGGIDKKAILLALERTSEGKGRVHDRL